MAPLEARKRHEKWKDIVRHPGPAGLRLIRGLRNEALRGEWRGHRWSRPSRHCRVIHRVETPDVVMRIVEPTRHDRRKRTAMVVVPGAT